MRHWKATHKAVLCKAFLKGNCDYPGEDYYYTHTNQTQAHASKAETQESEQSS